MHDLTSVIPPGMATTQNSMPRWEGVLIGAAPQHKKGLSCPDGVSLIQPGLGDWYQLKTHPKLCHSLEMHNNPSLLYGCIFQKSLSAIYRGLPGL